MKKLMRMLSCLMAAVMVVTSVEPISVFAARDFGWEQENGNWYWYENGVKQGTEGRGKEIYDPGSNAWYWLDSVDGGKKATNKDLYQESDAGVWAEDQETGTGKWVRYDGEGHMVKGWYTNENGTYYFDPVYGTMAKGYAVIDGQLYSFDEQFGTGVKCGFDGLNGWVVIDGNRYWYENGVRQGLEGRGKEIYDPKSDAWYWLDSVDDGKMAVSKDVYQESAAGDWAEGENGTGKWVRYDRAGHMIKGWSTNENGTYYFDLIYGTMAKGVVEIDGKWYEFDKATGVLIGECGQPTPQPTAVPTAAPTAQPDDSPEAAVTRGEWVAALVDRLGYGLVDESRDENGNVIHTYSDIEGNSYARKIETAYVYGILPKESSAPAVFNPDGKVSREFAAYTSLHALGFEPEGTLNSSDAGQVTCPKEAAMAVSVGILPLKDGAFRPAAVITEGEKAGILAFVDSTLAGRVITETHQELEYKDEVVEELTGTTDYRVENTGNGGVLVLPRNAATAQLKAGDIIVLPETETMPQGVILKVTGTSEENGEVKVSGEIPTDPFEVYDSVWLEGTAGGEGCRVTPAEGVTVQEVSATEENGVVPLLEHEDFAELDKKWKFTPKNLPDGLEASVTFGIPSIYYRIKSTKNKLTELTIEIPNTVELKVEASGELSGEIELGTISYPIGSGFSVDIVMKLVYGVEGKARIEYALENIVAVQYKPETKLTKLVDSEKTKDESELSVSGKAGINVEVALAFLSGVSDWADEWFSIKVEKPKPIYNIFVEAGAGFEASVLAHGDVGLTCVDAAMYLYLDLGVGDGSILGDTFNLKHTWEIFDRSNSPVKAEFHYENGKRVAKCTYGTATPTPRPTATPAPRPTATPTPKPTATPTPKPAATPTPKPTATPTPKPTATPTPTPVPTPTPNPLATVEEGETVEHSGEWKGLTWRITDTGKLIVNGNLTEQVSDWQQAPWRNYSSSVKTAYMDFTGATNLSSLLGYYYSNLWKVDLSNLDTSEVTDMSYMFGDCRSLSSLDLSGLDTSSVTNMSEMFAGCRSLSSLDLSGLDTSSVTNMSHMFDGCSSLSSLDLSGLDTSSVTNMSYMFCDCSSLSSLDLSSFDTSSVTDMSSMFMYCSSLSSLDLSGLDTSSVEGMSKMFWGCSSLSSLDLSGLDTSSVTDMSNMFYGCSSLSSLDLSRLDTSSVTDMSNMFYGCSSLSSLDLSSFDTSKVTNMTWMFGHCTELTEIFVGTLWKEPDSKNGMFYGCGTDHVTLKE